MPDNVDVHIKNLYFKLQLLLKRHASLIKENEQLANENKRYQIKERELIEESEQLQQQVNILKTSAGKLEGKEKSDFEKSINQYLRSIDKCITLLNK